jgi:hypothetical protein
MVGTDPVEVGDQLGAGLLACPDCGGALRPWGHARWRTRREETRSVRHRPRRASCSGCGRTHVLLPASGLLRRADSVSVIGAALLAKAGGAGHRKIAAGLGRPASTVRGWLRRLTVRAEAVRVLFTGLLHALDPQAPPLPASGSVLADAVEVLGRAVSAAVRRLGPVPAWQFAATASAGRLLAPPAGSLQAGRAVSNTS